MLLLSLDLSTSVGWALFRDGLLIDQGQFEQVKIRDFNVNAHPNQSAHYPGNIFDAAYVVAGMCADKIDAVKPDHVVVENTVKGRNRHTQKTLEWIHFTVLTEITERQIPFTYIDPSEWRSILDIRLSAADKANNKDVKKGVKRGKINRKHLAIRYCNKKYGLSLLVKHDDLADAICLGEAYLKKYQK